MEIIALITGIFDHNLPKWTALIYGTIALD